MNRAVVLLLGAGVLLFGIGAGMFAFTAVDYLSNPYGVDSFTARRVYRVDDRLVSYDEFAVGSSLKVAGAGLALVAGALVLGAVTWRGPIRGARGEPDPTAPVY